MKKKLALFAVIFGIMASAVACGQKDCKAKGCSEEVYKDGYCEEHYFEKAFEKGLEELGGLFK
jgi:hypothetical protein